MKIKFNLIAIAIFSVASTSSFAQSSVTLYGTVDGGLIYTSKSPNAAGQNAGSQFSMIDSGLSASQFGLKGNEDLGGGLKASFELESGISVANGGYNDSNGNLFGRQAWVALSDQPFGEVKIGLQYSPFFLAIYDSDPRDLSQFGSGLITYADNVILTGIFNANAVSYTSPTIAGFQGSMMMALGGEAGDFQAGRQYSGSLKYDHGGLMINASIYDGNSGGTADTPVPTTVAFEGRTLGAAYRFGALTAKASFVNYKVAGAFDANVYGGGLDYLARSDLDVNGGVWVTSDRNDSTNHSLMAAVGANYLVSRQTTLYTQIGVVNNHGTMNTGLSVDGGLTGVLGTTTGVDVGIRHTF